LGIRVKRYREAAIPSCVVPRGSFLSFCASLTFELIAVFKAAEEKPDRAWV
jgi:hypothetical protein